MRLLVGVVVVALIASACTGAATEEEDSGTSPASTTTVAPVEESTTTVAPVEETTTTVVAEKQAGDGIAVAGSSLGDVLVDDSGLTLYIFTVDVDGESACYDSCEDTWPVVAAGLAASDGLDLALGSTTRTDGFSQQTVNGRPVYLFAGDSGPGDVNGQGVGGVWFVIGSDGEPITG